MSRKVLVAFGSKRGATKEIAQKIGEFLVQQGAVVDVLDAGMVENLTPYGAVILGSSVYIGLWHRNAVRFLKKHGDALKELPVWLFISGPTGEGDPVQQMDGWLYPKSLKPIIEGIKPLDILCFGGKLIKKRLNPLERWIINKVQAPEGDFRNWKEIEQWAKSIVPIQQLRENP